jgi:hypothetical protein
LVGRESELGLVSHAIDSTVARHRAHFLLLLGDAGMGKTRLAEEAAGDAGCRHDALVLEGRCVPYGEANVWWPVAEALRGGCGITPDDPLDVARERCRETVASTLPPETTAAEIDRMSSGLLQLMGFEEAPLDIEPARAREEAIRSSLGRRDRARAHR